MLWSSRGTKWLDLTHQVLYQFGKRSTGSEAPLDLGISKYFFDVIFWASDLALTTVTMPVTKGMKISNKLAVIAARGHPVFASVQKTYLT